jgi:hypothetical protein
VQGVDNLGQQHGRGQLRERVAEPENETTGAEHFRWLADSKHIHITLDHQAQLTSVASRESVDETTNNHKEAAKSDAGLTSPSIGDSRP